MSADPSKPGEFHPVFLIGWSRAGGYPGPKEVLGELERDLPALLLMMNNAAAEFASGSPGEGKVLVFVEGIAEDGGSRAEWHPVGLRLRARVDATGRRPELREAEALGLFRRLAAAIQEFVRRDRGGANAYYVKVEGDDEPAGDCAKHTRISRTPTTASSCSS